MFYLSGPIRLLVFCHTTLLQAFSIKLFKESLSAKVKTPCFSYFFHSWLCMMSLKVKMSYTLKSHSPAGHIFHIRLGNQRVSFKKREKAKTKNDNLICLENLFIYLPPCRLLQPVTADGCSSLSLVLLEVSSC